MTWQLASFTLLGAALLGGFAWYERSHPTARVLALVATLAALAVLGRIAFAAIPNVKPTTDIVLISGYVFGGAPGFAVGAVGALVSNFFFTQGPWTPWQMVAWGGVGVFGAALARVVPDPARWGRLPLALACGLSGLAFGFVVNFGSVVTFGDEDLWRRYVAYQTISLPWDLVHAGANVVFFYVFGPALVRTLRRFRTRMEFTWQAAGRPRAEVAGLLVALVVATAAASAVGAGPAAQSAFAAEPPAPATTATTPTPSPPAYASATPTGYLERAQNRDGGFGAAPGQSSVDLYTGWAALGLAAQGINPADVVSESGRSVLDYVRANARGLARARSPEAVGDLERTILVVAAAGADPRRFAGQDLVRGLEARFAADGSIVQQVNLTAFGIFALRAGGAPAGDERVRRAAAWIARQQNRDGGFGFATRGMASDIDDTAAALQALAAAGGQRAAEARAVAFLRRSQKPDGGLPLIPGGASNAQSTAWAIQGFVAAGIRPETVRRGGSRSAPAYLRSLVGPGGVTQFSRSSRQTPVWVTSYAALALSGKALPLAAVERGAKRTAAAAGAPAAGAPERAEDDGPSPLLLVPIAAAIGLVGAAGWAIAKR